MTPKENHSEKASDRVERLLLEGILDGTYPPDSDLPGERDLSKELGVARPALREALQRLSRDGWLEIQQGKSTHVNDIMRAGNLNVLIGLLRVDVTLLPNFVPNLLEMWSLMAPAYTRKAVTNAPKDVYVQLYGYRGLADHPRPYARAMWRLHRQLIDLGGNLVFGLALNSFYDFYFRLAVHRFTDEAARAETRVFWEKLYAAAINNEPDEAAELMWAHMQILDREWSAMDLSTLADPEDDDDDEADEDWPDADRTEEVWDETETERT